MDKLDLICKFVYLGDKEIGETIDVIEERLIVKMGAKFAAIPLKNIERVDGERVYISPYDESQAMEEGKKWEEEKSKPVSLEELKIFGFGEESKNRFSVILKEIGDYEDVGDEVKEDVSPEKEMNKDETPEDELKVVEREEDKEDKNKDEEETKEKRLGEGIIDKL